MASMHITGSKKQENSHHLVSRHACWLLYRCAVSCIQPRALTSLVHLHANSPPCAAQSRSQCHQCTWCHQSPLPFSPIALYPTRLLPFCWQSLHGSHALLPVLLFAAAIGAHFAQLRSGALLVTRFPYTPGPLPVHAFCGPCTGTLFTSPPCTSSPASCTSPAPAPAGSP